MRFGQRGVFGIVLYRRVVFKVGDLSSSGVEIGAEVGIGLGGLGDAATLRPSL